MRRRRNGLNIVPFIDVMLVLLAIVLSVSTFIASGGIELASAKNTNSLPANDEKLLISVDKDNNIYLDDKISSLTDVENSIKNLKKEVFVEIRNDKNSKFELFIAVIDILKTHKHEKFAVALDKKE